MRTWRPTGEFQLLTIRLVAIQRLDGQQDVLVLQVFNVREDWLELWAEKAEMVVTLPRGAPVDQLWSTSQPREALLFQNVPCCPLPILLPKPPSSATRDPCSKS